MAAPVVELVVKRVAFTRDFHVHEEAEQKRKQLVTALGLAQQRGRQWLRGVSLPVRGEAVDGFHEVRTSVGVANDVGRGGELEEEAENIVHGALAALEDERRKQRCAVAESVRQHHHKHLRRLLQPLVGLCYKETHGASEVCTCVCVCVCVCVCACVRACM